MKHLIPLFAATAMLCLASASPAQNARYAVTPPLNVARLTTGGKLLKPANLDQWVFVGASLGMGYNAGSFNASRPGQFQVVLMEPVAHEHFMKHGSYAPGTMFLLNFYDTVTQPRAVDQNGFTQDELTNFEIHVIEAATGPERHSFYLFGAKDTEGDLVPPGNACVRCHTEHGVYDGTFAQFYPALRPKIPKDLLEKAARAHIR